MYVLSLENYPKYDLQATTSHRAVQRWCPFNTTHNLWKSTLGKKNTGCVVRIGWKVATLDLRKGHLSKQMSLLLQEAKQNLAKSKESVARTSPLRKRSHFLVIPPAYFLVCIASDQKKKKRKPCHSSPHPNPILSVLPTCWWNIHLAGGRKFASHQPRDGCDGSCSDAVHHLCRMQWPGSGAEIVLWEKAVSSSSVVSVLRKGTLFAAPAFLNSLYNINTHICIYYAHYMYS